MNGRSMRARLTAAAKQVLAHGLYLTGLLSLIKRRRLQGQAVVLTYHRVLGDDELDKTWSHPAIIVRRRSFERHLAALRRHFTVLSLDQFTAHVEAGRPFDRPSCLVTFDDGWLDTYTEAWPALRAQGLPAVVFLPVDFIGARRLFWQERAAALLYTIWQRAHGDGAFAERARAALAPHGLDALLDLGSRDVREGIMDALQTRKVADPASAQSPLPVLAELAGETGEAKEGADAFMTWAHVHEMAADGIAFGGHGVTHRLLTTLSPPDVLAEVQGSRAVLERELPGHAVAFCYPNGNWSPAVAEAVRASGFRVAFSTERGPVGPGTNRFAVRRINMHEDVTSSVPLFLARLAGVL